VKAMKLYCDMQSLETFIPEYVEQLLRLTPIEISVNSQLHVQPREK
jgi:hypothetical protein